MSVIFFRLSFFAFASFFHCFAGVALFEQNKNKKKQKERKGKERACSSIPFAFGISRSFTGGKKGMLNLIPDNVRYRSADYFF